MEPTGEYTFQYLKDHPGVSYDDEIKKKYNESQQGKQVMNTRLLGG
jgi:hypothetical protein